MIEKICPIHNVPVEGEKCSKDGCDARPIISTTLYWCTECRVPVFGEKDERIKNKKINRCPVCGNECEYISTDLRPVIPEEKLLLAILFEEEDLHVFDEVSVWNSNSGYYFDGIKRELSIKQINSMPLSEIHEIKKKYDLNVEDINRSGFDDMVQRFIASNANRYYEITDEAIKYIQGFGESNSLDDMFVSFSGGKDSTVTSDLVTRAFAKKVTHIFGDTTLEFPTTYEYRDRFAKSHRVLRAKNYEKNFEQLCEEIGPPSRVMRWCCTVFKTGAITKTLSQVFKDKINVLTFYGIRKSESASRSKYDRESESPKITKQTVVMAMDII